jgi:hypothetical protein
LRSRWRRVRRSPFALAPLALATVLGLAPSCGPVAPPPPSAIPSNSCPPDSCASYPLVAGQPASCNSNGQCTYSSLIDFTLVISLPITSFSAPGVSFAIPNFITSYVADKTKLCGPSCAFVPAPTAQAGELNVDGTTQICARRPNDGGAILPADVEFFPLWSLSATSVTVPASTVGLPLLNVAMRTEASDFGGSGPSGTPATEWKGLLAPGRYEEDIVPVDPNYPPKRFAASVQSSAAFQAVPISADPGECEPSPPPFNTSFNVVQGTASLEGFTVYVRDPTTLRRISSLATLTDAAGGAITILTSGVLTSAGEWPSGSELVVAAPDGVALPTYADTIAPVASLGQVTFPSLPTPVTVSGFVQGPDGASIDADLLIDSTPPSSQTTAGGILICTDANCTSTESGATQRPLSYSTTAHATATAGYSVALPPGEYDIAIIPAIASGPGIASVSQKVQPALQGVPPVAAGRTLVAGALASMVGTVKLADGRLLVGASVEAHAALALETTLDPILNRTDPRRWPREASAVTDVAGTFSLSVDPGLYDIVVRPVDGTGFPWVTLRSQIVGAGGTLSFSGPTSEIVVPAPVFIDMTLNDSVGAVAGAVVRAYFPLTQMSVTPVGAPPPEVELGAWLTDANGHFSMFVTPPVQ